MKVRGAWESVLARWVCVIARRGSAAAIPLLLVTMQVCWPTPSQAASLIATSTSVLASPNPSNEGTAVTFIATVIAVEGSPRGTVHLRDGATTIGNATLDNGRAVFVTADLSSGIHSITAVYDGNNGYAGSVSPVLIQIVGPPNTPTSTVVTSSVNPSLPGQSVRFTATVTGGGGTPSGTVQFYDNGALLGSVTLVDGRGFVTTKDLYLGNHNITARYSGDARFERSASLVALVQVVTDRILSATATSLASSVNPSARDQAVTFLATVSAGAGTPTGDVQFYDGVALLGTAALAGGQAPFTTAALAAGSHMISARYGGDANFLESGSPVLVQLVTSQTLSATSTIVTSSANPSALGQIVTFTATVSSGSGTPVGSVQFLDGGALLGAANLAGGTAQLATSALAVGSHTIEAVYGGDSGHAASTSAPLMQVVSASPRLATTTRLVSSASESMAGQPVTFTATVSSVSGVPTGSVQLFDGNLLLGTASLSGGTARVTTSSLLIGSRLITALYSGDDTFAGSSSSPLAHRVLLPDSRPILRSSANPSVRGQPVTFEVLTDPSCEGTVTFMDGSAWVGTALPEQGGRYRLTLTLTTLGVHRMAAVYAGGAVCPAATSETLEQTVQPAGTATAISATSAPDGTSGSFVLTATIQVLPPGSGAPTGEVVFRDGETLLGRSNVGPAGVATLPVKLNPLSPHAITAQYGGSGEFVSSASVRLTDLTDLVKPDFEAAYVVNSASFAPGLSPSGYATIFGSRLSGGAAGVSSLPYPTAVQGVRVTLNGSAVPLVYVSDQQINFVVPADAAVGSASLVVSTPLGTSKTVTAPLLAASPGIFADATTGFGAILIAGTADTTLARPVLAGEYVEIYCTGLGAVDASKRTLLPATVRLGGRQLTPSYSGVNPVYPGLYQVNLQIPSGLSGQQTLSIEINSRRSNEVKIRLQ